MLFGYHSRVRNNEQISHSFRSDDEDDEDEDDEDDMPQQRYKLRENKPITKRYTAPPPKSCMFTSMW